MTNDEARMTKEFRMTNDEASVRIWERTSIKEGIVMKRVSCWSGMECLESRRMLAGNVTAEVLGGVLTIHGDSKGNGLVLDSITRRTGPFRLSGDATTTINGQSAPVDLAGFSDVKINLGAGKNSLEVHGMRL